jgi:hypothetical protein
MFVNPKNLAADLAAAIKILDEVGADPWDTAWLRAAAAGIAAAVGNIDLARREATVALENGRRLDSTILQALGLYALGLASWQSDPTAARAALEEHVQLTRAVDYDQVSARVLALLAQLQAADGGDAPGAVATMREALSIAHIDDDRPASAVCLARGAIVMAAHGELETAAIFLGAVAQGVFAGLTVLPANEISGQKQFMAAVRSELGDERYAAAAARGAAMTYEQIGVFALAAVENLRHNEQHPSTT